MLLSSIYGTEWPVLCRCAVKKLLTHSRRFLLNPRKARYDDAMYKIHLLQQRFVVRKPVRVSRGVIKLALALRAWNVLLYFGHVQLLLL